jgi:hypothetical protein
MGLSTTTTFPYFLNTGNFNLHLSDNQNSRTNQFLSVLDSSNLVQLVTFPTHRDGHSLDLIITNADSFHATSVSSSTTNPRKLWTTSNKILHRKISNYLPTCPVILLISLIHSLSFFSSKIHKIHTNLVFDVSQTSILIYIALIFLRNLTSSYTCFT